MAYFGVAMRASQMMDESTLRRKAREAIQTHKLPNRRPARMWGGQGLGSRCEICDQALTRDEIEFELEFTAEDGSIAGNFHLHAACFGVWQRERQTFELAWSINTAGDQAETSAWPSASDDEVAGSSTAAGTGVLSEASNDGTITNCECETYRRDPV
jgi:hypothetical protein